jgi:hypothetical protein
MNCKMGAASSSAYWHDNEFNHQSQVLIVLLETIHKNMRTIEDVHFKLGEVYPILEEKKLFPEITLILDIDFTLGQASTLKLHPTEENHYLIDNHKIHSDHLIRILNQKKGYLIHEGTCLFFIRPYFEQFIRFVENNFKEVIIWTNGVQKHADDLVSIVEKVIGKRWRGYGRTFSTYNKKIVTSIGLDPSTTWLVDDDHSHYYISEHPDYSVNPDIKFFHGPEFSVSFFKDLEFKLPYWGNGLELYDHWFMFLIYSWYLMKTRKIEMKRYIRSEQKFICENISK